MRVGHLIRFETHLPAARGVAPSFVQPLPGACVPTSGNDGHQG